MSHESARGLRFQPRLFQLEIPFRWPVRIVNQHEAGIMFQSFRLLDHCQLVLANEASAEELGDRGKKRHAEKDVPRRADIDPAMVLGCWRDRGKAGEPFLAAADDFVTPVGQDEVDGRRDRLSIYSEQLVGRAVRRRLMRGHAEAAVDGLELFLLLVDTLLRTPPPGLMNEGTMRRIHEPDDAVVHVTRQISPKMRAAITLAELGNLWNRRQFRGIIHAQLASARLRNVHPHMAVALLARKRRSVNTCGVEGVLARQRRTLAALPRYGLEGPAVILAGNLPSIEPSVGKRNAAVWTGIAHSEVTAHGGASQDQWNAQQHGRGHVLAGYLRRSQRGIPVVI